MPRTDRPRLPARRTSTSTSGNWRLASGRWFSDSELRSGAAACIIGQTTRQELLGGTEPIGARLRLRSLSCTVIGVLQSKGKSNFGQDRDDTVVIPLRTMQRRLTGNEDVTPGAAVRPLVIVDARRRSRTSFG